MVRASPDTRQNGALPAGEAPGGLLQFGLENLGLGFAVFDRDLRLVFANRTFRDVRGYPAELCEPGAQIGDIFKFNAKNGDYGPGEIAGLVEERLKRARSRTRVALEYDLRDGRVISVRYTPLPQGALLLSYEDVTSQRKAERALAESEERYALAMAGADEGMWDWRAGGDRIFVSERYRELIRREDLSEVISLDQWVALIHPDDRDLRDRARQAHFDGRLPSYRCEYRVRCGDGEYRWFRDLARSLRDDQGRVVRMVGSLIDVTDRKKAEAALQAATARIEEQNRTLSTLSRQLSKYLSPQVYDSIFTGKRGAGIESRRKKLTIVFTDIVDFAETTEGLEPEELAVLLNRYLTEMSRIALAHGATIDKFLGDALLVFFGDPGSRGISKDALSAVRMAMVMQERMLELEQEWHDRGIERPFRMRIGISTGFCAVGNFGSKDRMDYTVIGSEVNLASRLQSHAAPGEIVLSHETFSLVKHDIAVEEDEPLTVKGFSRPVKCYRVIGPLERLVSQGRIIREYEEGVRIFLDLHHGKKDRMVEILEDVLTRLRESDAT